MAHVFFLCFYNEVWKNFYSILRYIKLEVLKMMQKFFIDGEVFNARIWKDGSIFMAECPELVTTAHGKTIKNARMNLKEVTRMFLEKSEKK